MCHQVPLPILSILTQKEITAPLAAIIALQGTSLPSPDLVYQKKKDLKIQKDELIKQKSDSIYNYVSPDLFNNPVSRVLLAG